MVSDLFKISRVAFQASFLTGIWPLISPIAILSLTASCTFGYQEPPEEVGLDDSQVGAEVRIYGENPATWSPTGGEIYDYDSDSWIRRSNRISPSSLKTPTAFIGVSNSTDDRSRVGSSVRFLHSNPTDSIVGSISYHRPRPAHAPGSSWICY